MTSSSYSQAGSRLLLDSLPAENRFYLELSLIGVSVCAPLILSRT